MTSRNVRRWRQNYNFETFTVKTRCIILRTKVERGWLLRAFSGRMFLCFSHSGIFEVISGTRKGEPGWINGLLLHVGDERVWVWILCAFWMRIL